jgi:hypothetical protein
MRHRGRVYAASHQTSEMRHVDQINCADFVSDLSHTCKVNYSWISAAAADDQLRALPLSQFFKIVVINRLGLFSDAIRNNAIGFTGKIKMMTVSEVPAMREIQPQDGVAGL